MAAAVFLSSLGYSSVGAAADALEFESRVGIGVYSRSLRFTDVSPSTQLLPLSVPSAPLVATGLALSAPVNEFSHLVVQLRGDFVPTVRLRTSDGISGYESLDLGALVAYALDWKEFRVSPSVGYEVNSARSETRFPQSVFPALKYELLLGGLAVRRSSKALTLELSLHYGWATQIQGIRSPFWFDHVSAAAVRAEASLGLRIGRNMGLEARIGLEQLGLDFNPLPASMPVAERAGGATDRAIFFTLGPSMSFPHQSR